MIWSLVYNLISHGWFTFWFLLDRPNNETAALLKNLESFQKNIIVLWIIMKDSNSQFPVLKGFHQKSLLSATKSGGEPPFRILKGLFFIFKSFKTYQISPLLDKGKSSTHSYVKRKPAITKRFVVEKNDAPSIFLHRTS